MRITPYLLAILVCLCATTGTTYAQENQQFSSVLESASYNARVLHQEKELKKLELFTGAVYDGYLKSIKGSAYFLGDGWTSADIKFRGIPYYGIQSMYDIHIRTLIVQHYNGFISLQIENDGIESFTMKGHKFRHFREGEVSDLEKGIYRYLASGKYDALALDAVYLYEKVAMTVEKEFLPKNEYYVVTEGKAHFIQRKDDLLKAVRLGTKEFRQIRKEHDLRWKKDKEQLIKIITNLQNKQ